MYVWFVSEFFVGYFILNELEPISLHISIDISSTQLNGFNFCYQTYVILFDINHLFVHWSGYKYCYLSLIILLNTIHLFACSQMVPSIAM